NETLNYRGIGAVQRGRASSFKPDSGISMYRSPRQLVIIISSVMGISAGMAGAAPVPVEVPDTMGERMKACVICHDTQDGRERSTYYPRIAGKPEGYLFNQLRNFRDGRRYYRPMALLLENATDQYLLEMAAYFSELRQH